MLLTHRPPRGLPRWARRSWHLADLLGLAPVHRQVAPRASVATERSEGGRRGSGREPRSEAVRAPGPARRSRGAGVRSGAPGRRPGRRCGLPAVGWSAHTECMTSPGPRSRAERAALEIAQPPSTAAQADARRIRRETPGDDPRAALQVMAQRLGHGQVAVETTVSGVRWFSWCGCGWVSTTTTAEKEAVGAVLHHVRMQLRAWQRTGLPLDAMPEPAVPDWEKVRKQRRHFAEKRDAEAAAESASRRVAESVRGVG